MFPGKKNLGYFLEMHLRNLRGHLLKNIFTISLLIRSSSKKFFLEFSMEVPLPEFLWKYLQNVPILKCFLQNWWLLRNFFRKFPENSSKIFHGIYSLKFSGNSFSKYPGNSTWNFPTNSYWNFLWNITDHCFNFYLEVLPLISLKTFPVICLHSLTCFFQKIHPLYSL